RDRIDLVQRLCSEPFACQGADPRQQVLQHFKKLNTEQNKNQQHTIHEHTKDKITRPVQFVRRCTGKKTDHFIATELHEGRCLKNVDILFSASVSLLILPNTCERYHDSPNPALSSLPGYGYCPPWYDSSRQA